MPAWLEDAAQWRLQRAPEFWHNPRKLAAVETLAPAAEVHRAGAG